jgi:predicted alpha/beta hydrolase family esterase
MFHVKPERAHLAPGWQNGQTDHWQSRWEALHGYRRITRLDDAKTWRAGWHGWKD